MMQHHQASPISINFWGCNDLTPMRFASKHMHHLWSSLMFVIVLYCLWFVIYDILCFDDICLFIWLILVQCVNAFRRSCCCLSKGMHCSRAGAGGQCGVSATSQVARHARTWKLNFSTTTWFSFQDKIFPATTWSQNISVFFRYSGDDSRTSDRRNLRRHGGQQIRRDGRVGLVMLLTVMAGSSAEGYAAMWVCPKIGVPQNGWFIMEIPIKMDDLGVPPFSETPTCDSMSKGDYIWPSVVAARFSAGPEGYWWAGDLSSSLVWICISCKPS